MSNDNDGGAAFPCSYGESPGLMYVDAGMTLRDYFAAKAMQSLIPRTDHEAMRCVASSAYAIADDMLKARGTNDDR